MCDLRAQIVILHDSLFFTSSVPGQRYTLTVNASGVLRLQGAHRILLVDVVFRRLQHSAARVLELENSQVRAFSMLHMRFYSARLQLCLWL